MGFALKLLCSKFSIDTVTVGVRDVVFVLLTFCCLNQGNLFEFHDYNAPKFTKSPYGRGYRQRSLLLIIPLTDYGFILLCYVTLL